MSTSTCQDIPAALTDRPQWVLWKTITRKGEPTKVPFQLDGSEAKSNDPTTWSSFADVSRHADQGGCDGIGYVFSEDDDFVGIDLDGCRDPETGNLAEWAANVIGKLDSYSEVSPSGSGVKIFVRGQSPFSTGKNRKLDEPTIGGKAAGVEIYEKGRYFCVTGLRLDGVSPNIEFRKLGWLRDRFWSKTKPAASAPPPDYDLPRSKIAKRARAYVAKIPQAVSKEGGHNRTYHVACTLIVGFALSEDEAWPILLEFNQRCEPPWSEHELRHKLEGAMKEEGPRGGLLEKSSNGRKSRPRKKTSSPPPPADGKTLPKIIIGVDEDRVIDETIAAVAHDPELFQRCGRLVQVVRDAAPPRGISRPQNAPRIGPVTFARLQEFEAKNARFEVAISESETEFRHPPQWVTNSVLARGQWKEIRRLEAIVESPTLRSDGTILHKPGYDESTGLIFEPRVAFPEIAAEPTEQAVYRAREDLLEVVQDFPFASDAHRAAWLSGLLTPLARYAFAGPSPLTLIDANIRGSGKSLLADVTAIIAAGRPMSRMTQPRDEEETRKRITSLALAGEPLILIDNIAGAFGDPSIDAALTATTWSDRVLGKSEMATGIPLYACWFATGNNVVLKGDTSRRVVHCRLESIEENPEERSGFVHADLVSWVTQERPRLTAAALTILAGYCAAGYPDMDLKPWGSFENWSALVRSAVAWCGLPDPGETRRELAEQADTEIAALAQLIDGWATVDPAADGMTVASVVDAINDYQKNHLATMPEEFQQLRDAISELVPTRGGRFPSSQAVGRKLTHLRRRVIANRYLDSKPSRIGNLWYVKTV
jgi:hypothetical protein